MVENDYSGSEGRRDESREHDDRPACSGRLNGI